MTGNTAVYTGDTATSETIDDRTRRARKENIEVEGIGLDAGSAVVTVSNDDNTDTYDVLVGTEYGYTLGCTCKDWKFRVRRDNSDADAQKGCKHMRAVNEVFSVVQSLADDEHVTSAQIRSMVDASPEAIDAALAIANRE